MLPRDPGDRIYLLKVTQPGVICSKVPSQLSGQLLTLQQLRQHLALIARYYQDAQPWETLLQGPEILRYEFCFYQVTFLQLIVEIRLFYQNQSILI